MGARPVGACGVGLAMLVGVSCGPARPACAPESDLAKITAAYEAEALVACRGQTFDSCKELPALREKFKARVAAWRDCQGAP